MVLKIIDARDGRAIARLLARVVAHDRALDRRVRLIVDAVRRDRDRALERFARRFDHVSGPIEVSRKEMSDLAGGVPRDVRRAIRDAARHITIVARRQLPRASRTTVTPGVTVEQRVEPLARVGCYVPGGRFPLPSSLLMT